MKKKICPNQPGVLETTGPGDDKPTYLPGPSDIKIAKTDFICKY